MYLFTHKYDEKKSKYRNIFTPPCEIQNHSDVDLIHSQIRDPHLLGKNCLGHLYKFNVVIVLNED